MPTYGKQEFKESNVNYLNKDFTALKQSLVDYAKAYFPNTYKDFNETSPGMMLLEMSAYVGDVTSFYIDQQYREMMLPLAEERRNIINMAKMLGYNVKPIVPSFVELSFKSDVNASSANRANVDYTNGSTFSSGIKVQSTANSDLFFETLDVVDFRTTGSFNEPSDTSVPIIDAETDGLITDYTLTRKVRAISAETKTKTFTITSPQKFRRINLPETNVIDIISCKDSNNNEWYEVDFLAQDKVPVKKHYTADELRDHAYTNIDGEEYTSDVPVPYSLEYITTSKRFTRETNNDNTTSLVFGNGILKNGSILDESFIDLEQLGIIIPGQTNDLDTAIDPLLGDEYSTLGETPVQTTLTITYRVGGGISSNAAVGDLTQVIGSPTKLIDGGANLNPGAVTNETPARGGADKEDTDEIREKARAFFTTQNRCVTKEDYEARTLNMQSRFGSIAKVIVTRSKEGDAPQQDALDAFSEALTNLSVAESVLEQTIESFQNQKNNFDALWPQTEAQKDSYITALENNYEILLDGVVLSKVQDAESTLSLYEDNLGVFNLSSISVNILSYDKNKNLVGNGQAGSGGLLPDATDGTPTILNTNLSNYLSNFKLLTDEVAIKDGYIINFGVIFDVVAHQYANKEQVKLRCIQRIIDYFKIEKMQFNQPIVVSQLEYDLMGIDGVRAVNYVTLTQTTNPNGGDDFSAEPLFLYSWDGATGQILENGTTGYGYAYNFENALNNGFILPPNPQTPAVFELKNPRTNVKGVVR